MSKGLYDIDSLDMAYQLLINDKELMSLIGSTDKVFKYHVPEEHREKPPIIRLYPISELPTEYADNKQLGWDCILQIDVWDSQRARKIALKINELMKTIDFKQSTPTYEFDEETYLIRDGRRYRGVILADKDLQE
ncbi:MULTISPECIES: DUF3168 domain-containing protein [unclassified Virgibacillus]|uniref:DUF3168 domain-containing protein n=1 Tax=unclassified Virgibacillus TaxID=2620237 RepID=UPI00090A935C|nr:MULTISPECIES: DUF3168 domain-containing protein [unclassified Virgibacillus]API92716.1 hypothetical protein BKP57_13410 [Virgibacillus sp. 6R]MBS7428212.1 DUF3168 domain-containing protein [Virgibacillus sp. 19R1-5]